MSALSCHQSDLARFNQTFIAKLYKRSLLVPPTNLTVLSETYVRRNGSGRFQIECIFDANPGAQLTWKYNNNTRINNKYQNVTEVVLSSNVYNTRKKTVLRIDMVDEQLQGIYQCIATNQQGNATQKTKLIVQCKYRFNIMLLNIMQKSGFHLQSNISCIALHQKSYIKQQNHVPCNVAQYC